jgi:hypothetical protein
MPKKQGRGPRKKGAPGGGSSGGTQGGPRQGGGRGRPGRGKRGGGPGGAGRGPRPPAKSDYFMQPGRRGAFIVLRRPIGNRIDAKICGTMPSRVHAKMLVQQLEKAESVVKDLFMEATDDGIEALEAVLAACRDEVMKRGPQIQPETASGDAEAPEAEASLEEPETPYLDDEQERA